jgi:hypothetical protein
MIRRRRPRREIEFSFDSFLDVVANVVGIILRLILVAWLGARSYKPAVPPPPAAEFAPEDIAALKEPKDPLSPELERQRQELARTQALLLEQLKQYESERGQLALSERELADLRARLADLYGQKNALEGSEKEKGRGLQVAALTAAELRERGRRVMEEIEALRRNPPPKQTLRYRTPISRPLQSEEWMFECRRGRVTLIDIGTLVEEAMRGMRASSDQLRDRWELREVTAPVGAFRLRYIIERERGATDFLGTSPGPGGSFRIGLSEWELEPVDPRRGETLEAALAPTSEFRRVVDHIEPRQAAVTMWVYPDSFPLFRRLRDYLYDHDIVVAGRPIPEGNPIAASRRGTASRGQ